MTSLRSTGYTSPSRVQRARRFVGGFYLSMGGIHLGIVAAGPDLYRDFADNAVFAVVRIGWCDIVMADPAFWGLMLFTGETVIGLLLLSSHIRAVRVGWALVIAFHILLMLFGVWVLAWSLPVLALVVPLAVQDWKADETSRGDGDRMEPPVGIEPTT